MTTLSILIPHYNTPHLLKILLDSIPFSDAIQVIVCDDRSTKDLDVLDEVKQSYPQVTFIVNTSEVKGAGASRNQALDLATGKFVLFADADDYFVNDAWDLISPYLDQDQDLVIFKFASVYLNTNTDAHRSDRYSTLIDRYLANPNQTNEDALRFMNPTPVTKLIKRAVLEEHQIRFDMIRHSEDVLFASKVGYYADTIIADPRILYVATRSEGSQTMTVSETIFDIRVDVLIRNVRFIREHLPKARFKTLRFESISILISATKNRLSFAKIIATARLMKKNGLRLLPKSIFHPGVFFSHLRYYRLKHKTAPKDTV
jgi:glycosyltransferase involved in cell wall biosynthesis